MAQGQRRAVQIEVVEDTQVEMGAGMAGVGREGLLVGPARAFEVTGAAQEDAHLIVGSRQAGIEPHRRAQGGQCRLVVAEPGEGQPQIETGNGEIGAGGDHCLQRGEGGGRIARRQGRQALAVAVLQGRRQCRRGGRIRRRLRHRGAGRQQEGQQDRSEPVLNGWSRQGPRSFPIWHSAPAAVPRGRGNWP